MEFLQTLLAIGGGIVLVWEKSTFFEVEDHTLKGALLFSTFLQGRMLTHSTSHLSDLVISFVWQKKAY